MTCSSSSMINAGSKPRCFQHNMWSMWTVPSATMLLLLIILLWHVLFRHVFCVDSSTIMYHGIFSHCWWHLSWAPMERKRSQHAHAWRTKMFSKGELPGNQDIQRELWCSKLLDIPIYKFLIRYEFAIFLAPTKPQHRIGLPLCRHTTTNSPCLKAPSAPVESSTCAALPPSMRFLWAEVKSKHSKRILACRREQVTRLTSGISKMCLCLNFQQFIAFSHSVSSKNAKLGFHT